MPEGESNGEPQPTPEGESNEEPQPTPEGESNEEPQPTPEGESNEEPQPAPEGESNEETPSKESTPTENIKTVIQETKDAMGTVTESLSKIESELSSVEAGGTECENVKEENKRLHEIINKYKEAVASIQSVSGGGRRRTRSRNGRKSRRASKLHSSRKTHRRRAHRRRTVRQPNFLYGF